MLTIRAEGHTGQTIPEVAADMVALARKLDACVEANLNGRLTFATPNDDPTTVEQRYHLALYREREHKRRNS